MFAINASSATFSQTFYEKDSTIAKLLIKFLNDKGWHVHVEYSAA